MSMRKSKWASPKKGTPSKTRRRSLNRAPGLGVSRTLSSTSVKKIPSALAANIKVAVRVRPENAREQAGNFDNIINVVDKNMLVFDPKDCDDTFFFKGKQRTMRDLNKKQKKDKKFSFDNVYGEDSTNQEIFEGTTKSIVDTLFDGYNCCVFAYGATGAGKTHTMLGNQNNPGITYLTMKEIFTKKETVEDMNFEIFLSYIEVYNEGLRDLLEPAKNLIIREDGKSGTTISGMTMLKPTSPQEVLNLLSMGNDNRTQAPTDHNKESSRSHAILQIIVQQKPKDAGIKAEIKSAKLSMIDLAGSEKGTATGHKGDRFREGSNINKSLLALGNCINALAAGSKYIPYRDSKLTRLLKDSVGGNCATVMIANISPSSQTYEDTLNALKYADRAKQIKVDLKKNVHNVEFHVAQYAKIVENLKGEIETLKAKIKSLEEENEEIKTSGGGSGSSIQVGSPCGVSERLAAATSGQADIDMEDLDSLSMITKLRQQLSVLIERQKDYDQLQQRISDYVQSQKASEDEKSVLSKENAELKLQLSTIEKKCEELNKQKINDTDDALEELMLTREQTLEQIGYIRSLLSTLELRIHYKTLQAEKCNLIGIVNTEKEKSEFKMNRSIESLKRKMERKKVTLANLLTKFHAENKKIQEKVAQNPISSTAIAAQARLSLEEHKTENILLHCVISSMEREFIRLNKDFLEAIPILVRDEKLLRGNGISTQEDKEKFTQLQAHVQSSVESVVFADNVKDPVPEEEYSVFKACCNLNLPSLYNTRRKSSNMEQKTVLLSDTMLEATQSETGLDETDSCGLGQNIYNNVHNHSTNVHDNSTNVQNHSTNVQNHSTNVHQNSSSEQDMDFTVDATSTSELSDFSKEDLQHEAPVPLKARDSIYLSRTNVQNGTGLLSKQAVLAVHNKVAESTSMPQQSKTIPTTRAELNSLSTNALPISSSFKATSPMASLSKKIKQDSLYLKSSTTSIKDKEVTAVNDLSSVKPIECFDSIFNRMKAKKENTNSEEIPPTPTLLKQSSGSQVQAPGVQPRNKSFLDRLPASTNNSPALTPDRRSSDIGVSSSLAHLTSGPSDFTSSSDCMNETVTLEGSSIDDTVATLKGSKEEQVAVDKGLKEEQSAVDKDKKRPLPIDLTTDSFESPGKKGKTLNETYCQPEDVPSAWLSHRGGSAIPDSPLITTTLPRSPLVTATPDSPLVIGELAQSPSIVDSTFTKGSMSPSPLSLGTGKGDSSLTDVIGTDNLLAQLGAKCAIQSEPVQTRAEPVLTEKEPVSTSANQNVKSDNLNSTFPVEELENEAMDVDPSSNILDISVIPPPKKSPNQLLSIRNKSPVRAKMGYSPTLAHRKHNPSPLRESTLLDLKKECGHTNSSSQVTKPSGHQPLASSGHQPTSSGHQPLASSGHQPTASSGHQPTAFSGHQPTVPIGQMGALVSSSIKGHQQSGFQSISKSGNKAKMLTSGSTKGKRTLTSSRSMSALLKPAAAHKLNLPSHPNRSRSPGDPLRATTVTSPTPPSYARTTQASSNKMSTLDRKNKGLENQRPAGGAITIKSTGLKRSNSSAAVRPKQI